MNKYIVGSILSLFSLLIIYGARSSGRVVRWVDGDRSNTEGTTAQADLVSDNGTNRQLLAQADIEKMTPLQKAGTFPQRQTLVEGAQASDINVPAAPNNTPPAAQPDTAQQPTPTQPNTTTGQGVVNPAPAARQSQPVRALW
ncbi:MAG: hypothetical protein AAGF01_09110 [Cyanobacteria bacterium P01_G01_bin.38]